MKITPTGELTFVPTLHPAALLYQPGNEAQFLRGIEKAFKAASGVPVDPAPTILMNPKPGDTVNFFETHADWAFDLETSRANHDLILSWSVATLDTALVWDYNPFSRPQWDLFKQFFSGGGLRIVQNGAFDLPILRRYGFNILWERVRDTMIAGSILDPDDYVNLGHLASKFLDVYAWKHEKQDNLKYNALDACHTARIWRIEEGLLQETEQLDFFLSHVMPLLGAIIIPLNETGIKLDVLERDRILTEWKRDLASWKSDVEKHFGLLSEKLKRPLSTPIGKSGSLSYKRVANVLYTQLGLPEQRHPKTKQITADKHALAKLEPLDASGTVGLLLRRSRFKELEVHLQVKPHSDGRVRSRYVLGGDEKHKEFTEKGNARNRDKGPATGRLASRQPNHQNVPVPARCIYVPTHSDWRFVDADSSQIELRMTQYFSGDSQLNLAIEKDAHLYVTWLLDKHTSLYNFGCDYPSLKARYDAGDVQVAQARQECKRISFGWSYRMGTLKLSDATGIPFERAQVAMTGLNATFPGVVSWWDSLVSLVRQHGYLKNPFGRRRYLSVSEVPAICNFLSQSTAADVLFVGQLRLSTELKKSPQFGRLIATVHDSNLLEGPSESLPELVSVVRSSMESPISELGGSIFPVSIKTGSNWKDLTKWQN